MRMAHRQSALLLTAALFAFSAVAAVGAPARVEKLRAPADLASKVGFDQDLGAQVPVQVLLQDVHGTAVPLHALLDSRPAILVPVYYRCKNLCDAVRAGIAHAVAASGLSPAKDFNVLLLSFDPREGPPDADAAQHEDAAANPTAGIQHWHYLTGTAAAIDAVMESIGFRYFFDARNGQYAHGAGAVILSPQGKTMQYLFGVQFSAETLRLALVNAVQGRIGNILDQFILFCCDYDASTGRYSLAIQTVMRALGLLTALLLGAMIILLLRAESGRPL